MKPKIVNTDEDTLNPMANVRNYGAGEEDGKIKDMEDKLDQEETDDRTDDAFDEPEIKDDERLPDEIADPAEDDTEDEMP